MATAQYTTDLTSGLITECESLTGWGEPTGFIGGALAAEDACFIQNPGSGTTHAISKSMGTGLATAGGLYDSGSGKNIPSPGAVLIWLFFGAPNALDSQTNGGMQVQIGNALTAFYQWYVFGGDTYGLGGWRCIAVDPTVSPNTQTGSPSGTLQFFGASVKLAIAVTKGNPLGIDVIRYGRCEARFAGGTDADSPCTFAGFAAANDALTAKWGLISAVAGGYQWQGLMTFGYGAACRFTDANTLVLVANTEKVVAGFNKIEIKNASSSINWTGISFLALGTVSKGALEVVDDCDVNIASCSFANMSTFIFKAASDVLTSTFRNCGQVTANSAKFAGTVFTGYEGTANTSYLIWDTNVNTSGKLDGCTFVKGTAATHAIEFGTTSPTAFTLVGVTFTGYSGSNNVNDSAIHIKRTTGDVTITIQGGTQPSYRTEGANVIFVLSSVSATVYAKDIGGNNVDGARVFLKAANGNGYFPYQEDVTIANSDTTATVTHTGHGLASGDKILIDGASHWQNNGVFTITKTGTDTYTYTMPSAPGSNPTGATKATFVVLEGLTSSGFITMSREFPSDQDVIGWVRKAPTAGPWFKPAPLTGTVDSGSGFSATAVMISDG